MIEPVTTGQIYRGSIPFIIIQLTMVAAVLAFPGLVMHYKSDEAKVDASKVKIEVDTSYGTSTYGGGDPGADFK
ncbi:hypothetical protein D3C72_2184550 [compost metagenome]